MCQDLRYLRCSHRAGVPVHLFRIRWKSLGPRHLWRSYRAGEPVQFPRIHQFCRIRLSLLKERRRALFQQHHLPPMGPRVRVPRLINACVALLQFKVCARTVRAAPCIPLVPHVATTSRPSAPQQRPRYAAQLAASNLRRPLVRRCAFRLTQACGATLSFWTCSAAPCCPCARCLERMASSVSRCPRWKRLFRIGLALSTIGSLRQRVALLRRARAAALLEASLGPEPRGTVASAVTKTQARLDRVRAETIRLLDERIVVLHRKLDRRLARGEAAQARSAERECRRDRALPALPA
jgi:hypothetical protein